MAGTLTIRVLGDTKQFEKTMRGVGDKMSSMGKSLTMGVTLPIAAAGGAAFKFAADFQDAMGAADQVFGKSGKTMAAWADSLPSMYGIAQGEALSYANIMGSLLQNIGQQTEKESAETSQMLVALAGDLTAMFGGTTQDAVRALTGALKGNTSMLDNYGIAANEASVKAKALEMGIFEGTGALTQQQKQAATLAIIMEQTAAAQGQAGREAKGASGQLRSMTTELKNMATDIGTRLLPVGTKLHGFVRGLFDRFNSLSPQMQNTILVLGGVAAAMGPVLIITGKLVSAYGTVAGAFAKLAARKAASTAAIVASDNVQRTSALKTAGAHVAAVARQVGAWVVLGAKSLVAAAKVALAWLISIGPIALIVAAVVGLAALIIANWDKIKVFLGKTWESIKRVATTVWESIKRFFKGAVDFIVGLFLNFTLPGLLIKHWDTIRKGVDGLRTWLKDTWGKIVAFFAGIPKAIGRAIAGVADLITAPFRAAFNAIARLWNKSVGALSFNIPSWVPGLGGKGFNVPNIPTFHGGGVVPGLPGQEVLIRAMAGETVTPVGGGGGDVHYHIEVHGFVGSEAQLGAELDRILTRRRRTSRLGFVT